jgi:hypothetical protein
MSDLGRITIGILSILLLVGCGEMRSKKPPEAGRYVNTNDCFSIKFPEQWDVKTAEDPDLSVNASSPPPNTPATFGSVTVATQIVNAGASLQQYHEAVKKSVLKILPAVRITGEATEKLEYDTAICLTAVGTYKDVTCDIMTYTVVYKNRGYVIKCFAISEAFLKHKSTFNEICKTFRASRNENYRNGLRIDASISRAEIHAGDVAGFLWHPLRHCVKFEMYYKRV